MARIPDGILGKFIGTAGNVSGYMRMNNNFVRTKRRRTNKPMTEKRLAQQQKLRVCNEFTKSFSGSGFFDKTFPGSTATTATGYNKATSALLKKAITGNYPETTLAWPFVLISEGGMPSPRNAQVATNTDGNLFFTWSSNAGTGTAKDMDIAVLVAYCPAFQQAAFLISDRRRVDGNAVLRTQVLQGYTVETWMGFISHDGKDASDSIYCGSINL